MTIGLSRFFKLSTAGILLLLNATVAFAEGGTGGGGGVVWQCMRGAKVETYLADVAEVEMAHSDAPVFQTLSSYGIDYVRKNLNVEYSGLGDAVKDRIKVLNFYGTTKKLDLLNDDNLPLETTINGLRCMKVQLAVQTFALGVVTYNSDIYAALSPADQVLFKAHEGLVSLQEKQFGNTAPIRAEILAAVSHNLLGSLTFLSERSSRLYDGGIGFYDSFSAIGPDVTINLCDSALDSSGGYTDTIKDYSPVSLEGECIEVRDANGKLLFRKENLKSQKAPDFSETQGKSRAAPDVNAENRNRAQTEELQHPIGCKTQILQAANQLGRILTPQGQSIVIAPAHSYVVWDSVETDPRFRRCSLQSCASIQVITSDQRDLHLAHITVKYRQDTCEVLSAKDSESAKGF